MNPNFDPTPYIRPPIVDVPTGVALASALLAAVPEDASDDVKAGARNLRHALAELRAGWDPAEPTTTTNVKATASALAAAWGAIHDRLAAFTALGDRAPEAARAAEVLEMLLPDGLVFLKQAYRPAWAESDRRIRRIGAQELKEDIGTLVGSEFLVELEREHRAFGRALFITTPTVLPSQVSLGELLRALSDAVGDYSIKVAATVGNDEESVLVARVALAPIDDLRANTAARRATVAAPAAPAPAGPVVPAGPVPDTPIAANKPASPNATPAGTGVATP